MTWNELRMKLRDERVRRGWRQEVLAARMEIKQQRLSDWERGKTVPFATHLLLWINALEIGVEFDDV